MTIKNYINIHDKKTFENKILTIKPFSMFGKDALSMNETREKLYKRAKEVGAREIELNFFSLSKFAEKVDFNLDIKKIHCGVNNPYSYDPDWEITFFINDEDFFKVSKSCYIW